MRDHVKSCAFFVYNELQEHETVQRTFEQNGIKVTCFACLKDCLGQLCRQRCDLLITDITIPYVNSVEVLDSVKHATLSLPVIIIIEHGDVPMAVKALKAGAFDIIEKPINTQTLLSAVESALQATDMMDSLLGEKLTSMENKILRLILNGHSNSEISYLLHRSLRTVEWHRSNIMRKFAVTNVVELVKRSVMMKLVKVT